MKVGWIPDGMQDFSESDYDSDDYIEYDEDKIPEVKLFHKFCRPLKENPKPTGENLPHGQHMWLGIELYQKKTCDICVLCERN